MNVKRFLGAAAALFIFMFFFEWLVHGMLLTSLYHKTPRLWREASQMMAHMPFNIFIQVVLAGWLSFIFARLFRSGGWKDGLRFGLYFGVLSGIQAASAYYWLPISAQLAWMWFFVNLIESLGGGFILGSIYRK